MDATGAEDDEGTTVVEDDAAVVVSAGVAGYVAARNAG
jgi:hypothetical protein